MTKMYPNQHEINEWRRMAKAAYANGWNVVGHRYIAAAAAASVHGEIPLWKFDELQAGYRSWLCFNDFKSADYCAQPELYRQHAAGSFR